MPASVRDVLLLIRTKEDAQRALAGISREMRRASATADAASARARAAALRAQASQMRSTGATRAQIDTVLANARAHDKAAQSFEHARRRTEMMHRAANSASAGFTAMGTAAIAGGAAILYGLKQAVDIAAEYDRQTRLTFTQVDRRFKPSLIELGRIGRRVAKEIAIPFEQIQPALFEVFSSTEANVKQAEALLKSFSKAAVAGQTDVQTASRATIGLMNAYSVPFSKVNRILDIQFQLVQEGVGTYEEWSQRIGLVTPSAVRAGQSIETMAAALATSTRMGVSAARAGTSVARAFDAISNPKTISKLEKMGVKMRDAKGNMLPLLGIMKQWKAALEKLPPKDRLASILETLKGAGSTIEARRFLQSMLMTKDGIQLFQDVLGEFQGDVGAFDRAYAEMAGGVSAKSTLVRNQWQLLKEAIGRALLPAFSDLLTKMQELFDWFEKLPEATKKNIAMFLLFVGVASIVGGVLAIIAGGAIALGFAFATLAAAGWEVWAIAAALVAGITLLVLAIRDAWENSQNFRDVIYSLRDAGRELWNILVGFAQDVAAKFRENLLPALQQLRDYVENELLPRFKAFVDWAKENLIPKLKEAANIAKDVLGAAFIALAWIITNMIIPILKDLVKTWDENKEHLLPILQVLGQMAKILLIVAAIIVGVFIVAFAAAAAALLYFGSGALRAVMIALAWLSNAIKTVIGWVKSFVKWIRGLGDDAQAAGRKLVSAGNTMKTGLINAFLGLPNMFRNIGSNIVGGLIGGMRGRLGEVRAVGSQIASAASNAVKAYLEVRSPSRVFKDIGYNVVQGLIKGILGSRNQLISALQRIMRDVMNSLKAGKAPLSVQRNWAKYIAGVTKKLLDLEKKRAAVAAKLAAAQQKVNDLQKARAELVTKITERLSEGANLVGLEGRNPQQIQKTLQKRLDALKKFQTDLATLKAKGLSSASISELAEAGVDSAGGLASKLANASSAEIQNINNMQNEIRKIAGQTGNTVAGQMYDAGIKAAQGLVKGLQSQQAAITKVMQGIANALIAQIRKSLGIKSPSRVFMGIGVNTAKGYILGYQNQMRKANNMHAEMMALTKAGSGAPRPVGFGSSSSGALTPTNSRTFNQTINVYTREIDPRKNAAELGWELEGRLR